MKETERSRIALKREPDFLPIKENYITYYGGDQSWFGFTVGICGGCGTVAAANLLAYLALKDSARNALYEQKGFSKAEYLIHMQQIYAFVTPFKIPFISKDEAPLWSFGWTFGVWPAGQFVRGVRRFAESRNVIVQIQIIPGRWKQSRMVSALVEALERDCPVAMLIGWNHRLDGARISRPDGSAWIQQNMSNHWVVITALRICIDGEAEVKVSTWGGYTWLKLRDYRRGGWPQAFVYLL